jgi:hypothetical protein
MEGSTITFEAKPQLTFFVVHPFLSPERWKETSAQLLATADVVVLNRPAGELRAPSDEVLATIRAVRPSDDVLIADVTQPLSAWAPRLATRVAALR